MNINKIELPASLIAELYENYLVTDKDSGDSSISDSSLTTPKKSEDVQPEYKEFQFLGSNNKQTLVLVNDAENAYLSDDDLTFLSRILEACNLSLGDIAIVNTNSYPQAGYEALNNFFHPKRVFLFGMSLEQINLPVSFPMFQVQDFIKCTYLTAPSLNELSKDKLLKGRLWECLKRIFSIS